MALTDPDDIIERLTQRIEFETSLEDVFNEDDLKEAIGGLPGGSEEIKVSGSKGWFTTTKEDSKQELINNIGELFGTDKVQDAVSNNFGKIINEADSIDDLKKIKKIESNVRDKEIFRDPIKQKADILIKSSTTGGELKKRAKAREIFPDIGDFDKSIEDKRTELILESINKEIKLFPFVFKEQTPSRLKTWFLSGYPVTLDSARTIKKKTLAGESITPADIEFQ
ncbi:hypothetical protein CMI43_03290 [Candidatus Pacearchaeota archaeon]|nr:hypothetical protein [Candidatus Pacearchaeota archaeon]